MESVKINHEGLFALEQPLLKVPIEQLKRAFKQSQKIIDKEMSFIVSNLSQPNANIPELTERLKAAKVKLREARLLEESYLKKSRSRIEYLNTLFEIPSVDSEEFDRWSKIRLNHLMVDYLSRHGFNETSTKFANDLMIEDLVDLDLFKQSQKIIDSLSQRKCQEALQWCNENKSNLKKIKSSLEFNLRLQEYIELVRERKITTALQYVRKFLTPWSDTHLKEIQQAMGLLAFDPNTQCHHYKGLYDQKRWDLLIHAFQIDNFSLNSLTNQSMLCLTLQAGLTALKTHSCFQSECKNVNCPVCSDSFGKIASTLPNSHHVNSSLVCRISNRMMDESNPPLVLPNGYVYSKNALVEMVEQEGIIVCPRTGNTYTMSDTRKAFIL